MRWVAEDEKVVFTLLKCDRVSSRKDYGNVSSEAANKVALEFRTHLDIPWAGPLLNMLALWDQSPEVILCQRFAGGLEDKYRRLLMPERVRGSVTCRLTC